MKAIAFNNVNFSVIEQNNQVWLRSPQIAEALGYKQANRITDVYNNHSDEFTDSMTQLVKVPTSGGMQEVRIFSLRGAHLLAMFARTPKAAAFRRYVLDILEQQPINQPDAMEVLRSGRWLMTFQNGNVVLNPVPQDALVLAPEELPFFISSALSVSPKLLPAIISSCAKRLEALSR